MPKLAIPQVMGRKKYDTGKLDQDKGAYEKQLSDERLAKDTAKYEQERRDAAAKREDADPQKLPNWVDEPGWDGA